MSALNVLPKLPPVDGVFQRKASQQWLDEVEDGLPNAGLRADGIDGLESLEAGGIRVSRGQPQLMRRSGSVDEYSNRAHSPAALAFAAMQYLPHPFMVLNSRKTLVMANDAMGILLGTEDEDRVTMSEDGTSALDRLQGQSLSQLGIDALQGGSTVWVSWDPFLDGLVDEMNTQHDACPPGGLGHPPEVGDLTPTDTSERAKSSSVRTTTKKSTVHDAVIDVVVTPKNIHPSALGYGTKSSLAGKHTFARMIITVWELWDETYFTLTFTAADTEQSPSLNSTGHSRKLLRASTSFNLASGASSPPTPISASSNRQLGSGSSTSSMMASALYMSMSTSAFLPPGPPFDPSASSTPSSLQKSIMLKDALVDNTEVPIIAMWKDGTLGVANKAARRLGDFPPELKTFQGGDDFVSRWQAWDETFSRKLALSEIPISVLVRTETPFASRKLCVIDPQTKRRRLLDCVGEAIRDENTGEFLAGIVTARDITNMTETINDLKQRDEQRFQLICDMMPQMIWTTAPDGLSDWFSTRWYDYTGLTAEESMGTGWMTPFHPDDLPESGRRWRHAVSTGTPFYTEYRCRNRSGEWRWMLGRALPWRNKVNGEIEKWFGTCTDVNEAVEARFEAKRTRQQLLSVIGHAKVTLFSVDRDRRITLLEGSFIWNSEKGKEPSEESDERTGGEKYIGKRVYEVFKSAYDNPTPDAIPSSLQPIEDILNGKTIEDMNEHSIEGRWYRTRFVPLLGKTITGSHVSDASIEGVIAVSMDITELKDRELEIQHQEKENTRLLANEQAAKEASRMKSQFLANMSHEIRTPIAGVIGMAELLLDQELNEDQRDCTENIQRSANGLLTVINDILDLSKVESGRLDIEEVQFSLSLVVRDVQKMLGFAAERKNLTFESEIDVGVDIDLIVVGDPGRVRQIITNLLTNSIKFTSEGKVKFSVLKERETADIFEVKFVVEDTGIGIEEEVRKRLFKPFSQADSSTARRFGGTGLGLTISKNLVDLMHGRITLESTLGQGTTATFWIPFYKPQFQNGAAPLVEMGGLPDRLQSEMSVSCYSSDYEQTNRTPSARAYGPETQNGTKLARSLSTTVPPASPEVTMSADERAKIHVLLVEDNQINQQIALRTIRKLGFLVSAVWNGKEALDYLLAADIPNPPHPKPDIILMDVQMPIIDGYKATHLIRYHMPFSLSARRIPIVAMTASAIQGDRERCRRAGMDDYLAKPVKGETLEKMLLRWAISKRDPSAPANLSEASECSEPREYSCGNMNSSIYNFRNSSTGDVMLKPTLERSENASSVKSQTARIKHLTLPGPESEAERAIRRVLAEEKATALRDEKLVEAAGFNVQGGDQMIPHAEEVGQGKGQRLTVENVEKLERESADSGGGSRGGSRSRGSIGTG